MEYFVLVWERGVNLIFLKELDVSKYIGKKTIKVL